MNPLRLAHHLAPSAIYERYRQATQAVQRTHWQVIYLKSQGKSTGEIAEVTGYSKAWIRRLIHRYNQAGPDAFARPRASGPGVVPVEAVKKLAADHARNVKVVKKLEADHARKAEAVKKLEADHARKSEELDTARQVQLSMLNPPVPDHPDLAIAAFMKTASELGGDYYDFHHDDDGTLTVAIGDATGHGAKAGMMVTATKSLFKAMGHDPDLLGLVRRITQTLKSLNLPGLYMHMTVGKYKDGQFHLVAAGMPPILVYRAATRHVEDVVLKGMPLGSFPDFPYQQCTITLAPGDTVLLMSDGYLELLNERGEMLEGSRVRALFEEAAGDTPDAVIDHLRRAGNAWANNRPLNDDVTFVVLKRKT